MIEVDSSGKWISNEYIITIKYSKDEIETLSKFGSLLELVQLIAVAKCVTENDLIKFDIKKEKELEVVKDE